MSVSYQPVSGEFLANTITAGAQFQSSIVKLGSGFIVLWTDPSRTAPDPNGTAVRGQRFDASGAPIGTEFLINTSTFGNQREAMGVELAGGGFVIAWHDQLDIYTRVYNANGVALGNEILANSVTSGQQEDPTIAALGTGFVMTWWTASDGAGSGARVQIYDATGARVGPERQANITLANSQVAPTVISLSDGGFLIVWNEQTVGTSPTGLGVEMQFFNADGTKNGVEITVGSSGAQAVVTQLASGNILVTWIASTHPGDTALGVIGRIYSSTGVLLVDNFLVNTATAGQQLEPAVAALSHGGFVVAWQDGSQTLPDTSSVAIRAQVFDGSGAKVGTEFVVNSVYTSHQSAPDVRGLANGGFVVSWTDASFQGGDTDQGIKARIYEAVVAAGEAPIVATGGGPTAFVESSGPASTPVVVDSGVTVSDADSPTLASALVKITGGFQSGQDELAFTASADYGNINGSYNAATGVLTLTSAGATATTAQFQAALRSVTYNNSSNTPTTASRTISFEVNDGTASSSAPTSIVTVTATNDSPTVTAAAISLSTINEDMANPPGQTVASLFGPAFADADGDMLAGVALIGNAATAAQGQWQYQASGSGTWTTIGSVSTASALVLDSAAKIRFKPAADFSGPAPQLTLHLADNSAGAVTTGSIANLAGAGGSSRYSGATMTLSQTIAAVNDAPGFTNLDGDVATFAEGGSPARIDVGGNALLVDDSSDFGGGNLFVQVVNYVSGEDLIGVDTSAATGVTLSDGLNSDSIVSVNGTAIGYIVDGSGTGNPQHLDVQLDSGATAASVALLVRALTYTNLNAVNPNTEDRDIGISLNDGSLSNAVATIVKIVADNDAPTGTDATITALEDVHRILTEADFGFVDDGSFESVTITGVTGGSIYYDADGAGGLAPAEVSLPRAFTAQELAEHKLSFRAASNDSGPALGSVAFVVADDGGASDGTANTLTVNVLGANDAPTSADDSVTGSENDPYVFTVADFPFSDIDGHTLSGVRITDLPNGGTMRLDGVDVTDEQVVPVADINAGKLTYTPTANMTGSPYATFQFKVIDNGPPAEGSAVESGEFTMTINVAPDNLAPAVDLNGGDAGIDHSTSYSEGGAGVAIGSGITVTDPNSGAGDQIEGATITIDNDVSGDRLTLSGDLPAGITVDPTSTDRQLKLVGTASQADYQAALALARFSSTSENPDLSSGAPERTIIVVVTDGSATSAPATTTITIAAENDGPANSVPGAQSGTEDTDLVFSTANGNAISVSDPDAGVGDMTVTLSVVSGTLTLADTAALSLFSGDGTSSVTLTGRASALNAALDGLVYRGNLNFEGDDTLTILTSDNGLSGTGGVLTDSDQVEITLADDGFINGDAGDNVLTGTPQRDIFLVQQGGNDSVSGLGSRDVFYFGDAFTADDSVDGGGNSDIVILQGNYLAPTSLGSITNLGQLGSISLFSSGNNLYGGATVGLNNYNLVATNDSVAAGQILKINGTGLQVDEDVVFDGSAELDGSFQFYGGQGTDDLTGGAMGDNFVFTSGTFGASDTITGGGGYDVLYLRGDYTVTFGAGQLSEIESIGLLSATEKVFASGGTEFDYEITWNDALLAAGKTITINGSRLGAEESMSFNGSMESDGIFRIFGGAGNDVLQGGSGADLIYGGGRGDTLSGNGGNDIFRYQSVDDSNSTERDGIQDFNAGDIIDLSRIDANIEVDGDQAFTFIGSAAFSNTAGELRFENISLGGPIWMVQGDVNGDGVSDYEVVLVINPADPITASDFYL